MPWRGLKVVLLDESSAEVVRWRPKNVARNDEVRTIFIFLAPVETGRSIYACCEGESALWRSACVLLGHDSSVQVAWWTVCKMWFESAELCRRGPAACRLAASRSRGNATTCFSIRGPTHFEMFKLAFCREAHLVGCTVANPFTECMVQQS